MSDPFAIAVASLAALAAAGAGFAWRGERARRMALDGEVVALRLAIESERRSLEAKAEARRGRDNELADLRQRLEKTKRRAFTAQEERAPLAARIAALETELGDRERDGKRLRDEVARLEGELEGGARERTRLRDDAARNALERDKAARVVRVDPDEHRALTQRLEAAEEEVRRLAGQIKDVERDALRYRQRERTHRRLYIVIRGELEAAKDRIRTLTGAPPGEAFSEPEPGDDPTDGEA